MSFPAERPSATMPPARAPDGRSPRAPQADSRNPLSTPPTDRGGETSRPGPAACRHCGLPVPAARRRDGDEFCCNGCRRVYDLIHEGGFERYYDLKPDRTGPPPELRPHPFHWLEPLLQERGAAEVASAAERSGEGAVALREGAEATPEGVAAARDGAVPSAIGTGPAELSSRPRRLTLDVQGIHCAACVWLLREMFLRRPGAVDLRLNPSLGQAEFTWIPGQADLPGYLAEAERFGYRFGPRRKRAGGRATGLVLRMGLCAAAAMNVMIFSYAFYAGLGPQEARLHAAFGRLNLGLTAFAVLVGGWPFFRAAGEGIRRGLVHLDLPIALGILLAFAGSVQAYAAQGPGAAYFDTVAIFVTLMLVGRWLQERILERNRNALLATEGIDHLFVRRVRAGRTESVPAEEIRPQDEIWVVPGDLVPVAAIVLRREARLSLDWITGESDVRTFQPGETAPAGAFNAGEEAIVFAAQEHFAESALHDLLGSPGAGADPAAENPAEAKSRPSPARSPRAASARWWHRVSTAYVAAVLSMAAVGYLLWAERDPAKAVQVTVAVLAVTCPCALGLAIPLAQELTAQALRRRGIFLRRASFLDRALHVRHVVFDKTGTVTFGTLVLAAASEVSLRALPGSVRRVLHLMVWRSNHPMSRALLEALERARPDGAEGSPDARGAGAAAGVAAGAGVGAGAGASGEVLAGGGAGAVEDTTNANTADSDASAFVAAATASVREIPGEGLEAAVDGRIWRLGRGAFACAAEDEQLAEDPASDAVRTTWLGCDGRAVAAFTFVERIRPDAVEEIARLRRRGFDVYLFSGDAPGRTAAVAREIGLEEGFYAGGLDPRAKAGRLTGIGDDDTMMVGDGLNDAPSFAAALCTATPAVDRPALPGRADLYFLGDGIGAVRRALEAAKRLRAVVRLNLALAALYNTIALALCFAGVITPLVAAILMPVNSAAVVTLTIWRLSGRRLAWMS